MLLFIWRRHRFPCVLQGFAHGLGALGHEEGAAQQLRGWHWPGGMGEEPWPPLGSPGSSTVSFGVLRDEQSPQSLGSAALGAGRGLLGLEDSPCAISTPQSPGSALPSALPVLPILPSPALPLLSPRRAPKGALGMLCELQLK